MNLSKLIHAVWEDERVKELGVRIGDVETIVKVFVELIRESLLSHKVVKIHELFTMEVRKMRGRRIRNPQTGEEMYSADSLKVGLKLSAKLKKGLKDLDI